MSSNRDEVAPAGIQLLRTKLLRAKLLRTKLLRPSRLGALLIAAGILAATIGVTPSAWAQTGTYEHIDSLIEEMQFEDADVALTALEAMSDFVPEVLYLRSRLVFFQGDYEAAAELGYQAVNLHEDPPNYMIYHRALTQSTFDTMRGYATHITAAGHFIIRYDAEQDEVLIPFAEEVLEAAYEEIGAQFNYWPSEPVRVEFYPRTSTLAAVSSLTEEQIQTSGTIALCKYNRLMVTSPRALVRGYTWRDTLSHEYVHLIIQHLTGTRVPIWLHEGLAKFAERRWRGPDAYMLPPNMQDLLSQRIEEDNLITFEQMHPSMALLPSQEDSGTAFAEVYTVIEYLYVTYGPDSLRDVVWTIREGASVTEALTQVTGQPFDEFVASWDVYLRGLDLVRMPSDFVNSLQFMPNDAEDAPPDELAGIAEEEARDFMHIGQLLRARGRVEASIVEYRKAESLVGSGNPLLQNWMARALLDLDRYNEALEALGEAARFYPGIYLTFLHIGEALNGLANHQAALEYLVEAAGINPFDPEVHRQLSEAYDAVGDSEAAARHREFAQAL